MPTGVYERTPEHQEQIRRLVGRPGVPGAEHFGWKEKPTPHGYHKWLAKNHPKTGICEHCGVAAEGRAHDYAFLQHPEPYTRDREDYVEVCRGCHLKMDRRG